MIIMANCTDNSVELNHYTVIQSVEYASKLFLKANARWVKAGVTGAHLVLAVDPDGDLDPAVLQFRPDEVVMAAGGVGLEQDGVVLLGLEPQGEVVDVRRQVSAVVVDHILAGLKGSGHRPYTQNRPDIPG